MTFEIQTKPHSSEPAGRQMSVLTSGGENLTLMDVWRVVMKQRFTILAVTVLSVAGAAWHAIHTTPVYESIGRIEIEPQQQANVGFQQLIEQRQNFGDTTDLETEVHILQSDAVLFETAQSLHLLDLIRAAAARERKNGQPAIQMDAPMVPTERRALIGMIRGGLKVTNVAGTNLVEIRYRNTNPKLAAEVVNRLVETYSDADLRSKYERTMHVSSWLQRQLADLKSEASEAQQALADYQKAHNIVGTDENSNLTIQTLEDISSSLDNAETDRITKEARMRDFDSLAPNLVALLGDNPALGNLRGQLADLENQRAEMSARYGPKYPKMIDLQTEIDKVQSQINSEVELSRRQVRDEYEGALGAEDALRKRLGQQEEAAYKLNAGAAQYAILRQQAELTRDLYDTLEMRLEEATLTAGLSAANITVVDSAQVPYLPVAPRKRLSVLMGFVGGLLAGFVVAFLIESIDDRLQTSDEVESISMLPSLAAIPHLNVDFEKRRNRDNGDQDFSSQRLAQQLVSLRDPKSNSAEAYRNLRSSLLLSSIDAPSRSIVVTSAFPEEGKTTTSINMAIVLAQRGERVLLVDADLRRGSLGAVFGLAARNFGLSTLLANPDGVREIPAPLPELPTLHVLSTGPRPPNPAEMLSSSRMEEQLRQWSEEFDRIVIDSAPLLAVSDTQAMAAFADKVVVVTRAGMTRRRALVRARDLLIRINAPIAGVVVNDVDVRLENFYTYRYGMYGYGYRYGGHYHSVYSDRAYGYENENEETD